MREILTAAALLGAALTVSATAAQTPAQTTPPPPPAQALRGTLAGPFELRSRRFAGTVRRYWVYVPPDYDPRRPPNLLLFQDGQRATNPAGSLRVPAVLDTLILQHAIPPTLGIFVTPGHRATHYPDTLGMANPDHRVEEYDALSDDYGWMTLNELLPAVAAR